MAGCSCHRHLAGWLQLSQTAASWLPVTRQASEVQSCLRSDCCSSPVCCARRAHVRNIKSLCLRAADLASPNFFPFQYEAWPPWRLRPTSHQSLPLSHQSNWNIGEQKLFLRGVLEIKTSIQMPRTTSLLVSSSENVI